MQSAMSVKTLSTVAQLYKKFLYEKACNGQMTLKVTQGLEIAAIP